MQLLTTQYTDETETLSKITLKDENGIIQDEYILYFNKEHETQAYQDLERSTNNIQHFIEQIYELGYKKVPINFETLIIPFNQEV